MESIGSNKMAMDKLVIGIASPTEARAYPIEIIGYHHQVLDSLDGSPVLVTYCTVCRTGVVYKPFINGHFETFRLVGMDHYNAMFEDATTKSWWRQVNGTAIAGPLKGASLEEIPSEQTTLGDWLKKYPNSLILQQDSSFSKDYKDLEGFDNGTIKGRLEHRDSGSWNMKSWVVGLDFPSGTRAYDWNELLQAKVINDTIGALPVMLSIEKDNSTFHSWSRNVDNVVYQFSPANLDSLTDKETGSVWSPQGRCVRGVLAGKQLGHIQSYQQFWHAWSEFRPKTTRYAK